MSSKYGIIFYKYTSNIGDDIQTFASKRFLPKIDYIIDRESLDTFESKNHEKVNVIMNGWYFHKAENWPPSIFINPKLISMHFTDNMMVDGWTSKFPNVLDGYNNRFFLNNHSVGCRDKHTQEIFTKLNINNYFSSCLTTTLELDTKKKVEDVIYVVDVSDEVKNFIEHNTKYKVVPITHVMTEKEQELTFEERMDRVEKLLQKYQNAKMVVTSRLHAALPCLALRTPVLLIEHDDALYSGRLETFYDFLNTVVESKLLSGEDEYDFNNPKKNPSKYLKYRKQLINDCEMFVEENKNNKARVSDQEYIEWLKKVKETQKENLKSIIVKDFCQIQQLNSENSSLKQAVSNLEDDKVRLNDELDKIYCSRSYKLVQSVKKIIKKQ